MKYLFLVRHAKSDWSVPGQSDFERKLNARGKRNAPMMAEIFREKQGNVDLLISSPAVRAIHTAVFFAEELSFSIEDILEKSEIYEASCHDLVQLAAALPESARRVVFFGHNPGMSLFLNYLSGDYRDMPTCAIAGLELHIDRWSEISEGTGSCFYFDYPRRYMPD